MASNYDDIRAYRNDEVRPALKRIAQSDRFWKLIDKVAPKAPHWLIKAGLYTINSIEAEQRRILLPLLNGLQKRVMTEFNAPDLELIPKDLNAIYISNHRDIIIDPTFMCKALLEGGHETAHLAIGHNLLIEPWIEDFVRLNRAFVVKRGGTVHEVMNNSFELSGYIHQVIEEEKHSIWIAQREGRAKDSTDHTQDSVLKMLAIGGEGEYYERLAALNICPVCLSYEYDPCDYLKAKEFQLKRDNPAWKKSGSDDMENMLVGIRGKKGRVNFTFTPCISKEVIKLGHQIEDKREFFSAVAKLIDHRIHTSYVIYPGNRVAYDLLAETNGETLLGGYTEEEKKTFEQYVRKQVNKVKIENPDKEFLRTKILEMYANPLRNKLAANDDGKK